MSIGPNVYKVVMATLRPNVATGGNITGKPFPQATNIFLPSVAVTAANNNPGTIFIGVSPGVTNATFRRSNMIPLTAGQTFTYTSLQMGSAAIHDIVFGTGYTYVTSNATPANVAICSYLKRGP